ncbi:hypothetical protein BKA65DRAFT_476324 [Rhexocercosporidium sp. MPI-PUGE-AT-0058]|nr:hypothetical protein BKA65DRAFT_476324 [Rhexocercosporidium sp. MPI-PUGE-AT-0058]
MDPRASWPGYPRFAAGLQKLGPSRRPHLQQHAARRSVTENAFLPKDSRISIPAARLSPSPHHPGPVDIAAEPCRCRSPKAGWWTSFLLPSLQNIPRRCCKLDKKTRPHHTTHHTTPGKAKRKEEERGNKKVEKIWCGDKRTGYGVPMSRQPVNSLASAVAVARMSEVAVKDADLQGRPRVRYGTVFTVRATYVGPPGRRGLNFSVCRNKIQARRGEERRGQQREDRQQSTTQHGSRTAIFGVMPGADFVLACQPAFACSG